MQLRTETIRAGSLELALFLIQCYNRENQGIGIRIES